MITPLAAAKAYASVQGTGLGAGDNASAAQGAGLGGMNFSQVLNSVMGDTIQASKNAEAQMAAQVQGKAQLVDVVTAISSAQTSLETVMAVRDQVISAYQEIMRMAI